MANQQPIPGSVEPILRAADDDEAVIQIPEQGQAPYDNLIKSCLNRLTVYLNVERPKSARTKISWFFSTKADNTNVTKKGNDVTELKNLFKTWQPSNVENTKKLLIDLSLKADEAQEGVLLPGFLPDFISKSNLAKAIDDVKGMIWSYLIANKPNVKDELFAERERLLKALEKDDIKNLPADEKYIIPGTTNNRFKNRGEQLEYEMKHLYPATSEANKALYEAQKESHKLIP